MENNKLAFIKELQSLLNVGPAMAKRLYSIGITPAKQLKKSDPEKVYEELRQAEGGMLDICVLYQIRGAIWNIPWWECKNLTRRKLKKRN